MAQFFESLSPSLTDFINQQVVYFVASSAKDSRVNLSPKGMDSFRVLDDRTVAYLDVTGSGNETAAHIMGGGKVTIMFCSFGEKPLILRLYGRGEVVRPGDAAWADLAGRFNALAGQRQIILLQIESLQTSCGFGVPKMQFVEHRTMLTDWAGKKSDHELAQYRATRNAKSIDGLPTGF